VTPEGSAASDADKLLADIGPLTPEQHENFLRHAVEAVVAYKEQGDMAPLVQFAENVLVTARLRRIPSYREASDA